MVKAPGVYVDALQRTLGGRSGTDHVGAVAGTSRFDTRIDYIMLDIDGQKRKAGSNGRQHKPRCAVDESKSNRAQEEGKSPPDKPGKRSASRRKPTKGSGQQAVITEEEVPVQLDFARGSYKVIATRSSDHNLVVADVMLLCP